MSSIVLKKEEDIIKFRDYLKKGYSRVILEFSNTKKLSSKFFELISDYKEKVFIRIAGPYNEEYYNKFKNQSEDFFEDVVYSYDECKNIVSSFEKIEKHMNPSWDDFQKVMYFINYIKTHIIYHPFFESTDKNKLNSLRGIVSGKTICSGFSLIFKEFCDRNNIKCDYVLGRVENDGIKDRADHAWNIVYIDGYAIPLDLTWHSQTFAKGSIRSYLGNTNEFIKTHYPSKFESVVDYSSGLYGVDSRFSSLVEAITSFNVDISNASMNIYRNDLTSFQITQLGEVLVNDKIVYKYFVKEKNLNNPMYGKPTIIYSTVNFLGLNGIYNQVKKEKEEIDKSFYLDNKKDLSSKRNFIIERYNLVKESYDSCVNVLFSTKNIMESCNRGDHYVGSVYLDSNNVFISKKIGSQIKNNKERIVFIDTKTLLIEEVGKINSLNSYNVYLPLRNSTRRMTVFTEDDLMTGDNYKILLSSSNLNSSSNYIGHVVNGVVVRDSESSDFVDKRIAEASKFKSSYIRSYDEDLTYDFIGKLNNTYSIDFNDLSISNKVSKEQILDKDLKFKVIFSHYFKNCSKEEYETIYYYINDSLLNHGFVNINSLKEKIAKFNNNDFVDMMNNLLDNDSFLSIVIEVFKGINPSINIKNNGFVKGIIYDDEIIDVSCDSGEIKFSTRRR